VPVLLAFIALPLIEIALFIVIGARIGVGATLGLILLSAVAGVLILRGQQARLQGMMQGGLRVAPGRLLADGAFRMVAGLLLVLPGFLTDALGLILLIPAVQRLILARIAARARVATASFHQQGDIIDGEFHVHEPGQPPRTDTIRLPDPRHH
jgi:UPF0716 protein FxsA